MGDMSTASTKLIYIDFYFYFLILFFFGGGDLCINICNITEPWGDYNPCYNEIFDQKEMP